jgi:hypothetical protein
MAAKHSKELLVAILLTLADFKNKLPWQRPTEYNTLISFGHHDFRVKQFGFRGSLP